jgi:hypothetical protein
LDRVDPVKIHQIEKEISHVIYPIQPMAVGKVQIE